MKRKIAFLPTCLFLALSWSYAQDVHQPQANMIILAIKLKTTPKEENYATPSNTTDNDDLELKWIAHNYVGIRSAPRDRQIPGDMGTVKGHISNGIIKYVLYSNKPVWISSGLLDHTKFINPGDSIFVAVEGDKPTYSGTGSESFTMQTEIEIIKKTKRPPTSPNVYWIYQMDEYFQWMKHLDWLLESIMPVIESYKSKIPTLAYNNIKSTEVRLIEHDRIAAFYRLIDFLSDKSAGIAKIRLKTTDLIAIWDSTQVNNPWSDWIRNQSDFSGPPDYFYEFNRLKIQRRFGFDFSVDSLKSKKLRDQVYYNYAKEHYKGLARERLMTRILAEEVIMEIGPDDEFTKAILADYYSQPGFPEYKQWLSKYESNAKTLKNGKSAPEFSLTDRHGNVFQKNNFQGKIVIMDFYHADCKNCNTLKQKLNQLRNDLKYDSNTVFVSVSVDTNKELWMKNIELEKTSNPKGIHLFTDGLGSKHPMIERYSITEFPKLFILDADGTVIKHPAPDPTTIDGMNELSTLIKKKRAILNDGPYIVNNDERVSVSYVYPQGDTLKMKKDILKKNKTGSITFKVIADEYPKHFTVKLKKEISTEPSVFIKADKQLVISDIEGNFDSFRKLLQANGVINSQFEWTYGDGHLICIGDFFDRGEQVTETLWLIYGLEEKARAKGGYVHFILGNHEIMNLGNDTRYVRSKYIRNAELMGVTYRDLFNEKTELGKWLRSKNIMEKIGRFLYVHGGISDEVSKLDLNISEINDLARSHYGKKVDTSNYALQTLYNSETSPFWYRGYYSRPANRIEKEEKLDLVWMALKKFDVSKIITGHTIVADTVSAHLNNLVINVDTNHALGKSEALLIDNNKMYRVSVHGKKEPIDARQGQPSTASN